MWGIITFKMITLLNKALHLTNIECGFRLLTQGAFMTNLAQIDKIISEVNELKKNEKIIFFHKMEEMFDDFDDKQDEDVSIETVFGLWKDRNITKDALREKAWIKN
jgi:hypothetical protein